MMNPFQLREKIDIPAERLVHHPIPEWARGARAVLIDDGRGQLGYECHQLTRVIGHAYVRGYGLYWSQDPTTPPPLDWRGIAL
jgi:hypothetical protein